jgi:hypothetical protein
MMKITFERHGGVAGRQDAMDLDLGSLPAEEGQRLLQLVQEADFFKLPSTAAHPSSRDEVEYTVTVEAGQAKHTVHTTDSSAPEALRTLIDALSLVTRAG